MVNPLNYVFCADPTPAEEAALLPLPAPAAAPAAARVAAHALPNNLLADAVSVLGAAVQNGDARWLPICASMMEMLGVAAAPAQVAPAEFATPLRLPPLAALTGSAIDPAEVGGKPKVERTVAAHSPHGVPPLLLPDCCRLAAGGAQP
jgi:hypothetical protein